MTDSVGPIFAAGFQHITKGGYEILYLPDLHNDELQREGKAPVYWWLPNAVRLARKNGDTGDYKFSFIHFEGRPGGGGLDNADGSKDRVTGGLLGFSTTAAPPASVLQESQDALLNIFRGNDDKFWGWRTPVAPMFRPAPIVSNTTTITNLSPNPDGTVPVADPPSGNGGPVPPGRALTGRPFVLRSAALPHNLPMPRSVPKNYRGSNLDMWYANLQGQGSGAVSPFAENAYSGLVGSIPAALIWTSFHGGTGGISVWQKMRIKVWSPAVHVVIDGDWDRIQTHFSAAAHAGGLFWSADVQAQFNYLRMSGGITVKSEVDSSIPNADKLQAELDKRIDLVFQKFMEQAQKTIFDPAPFNEKPAESSGGFLGFGGGGAFKLRSDQTHLHLHYEETKEVAYLQDYPISGQLEGLYDEIKADPAAEKKYFTTLYLGDWERQIARVVKPVVNWPDPGQQWVGEPVAFLSAQIGYPNTQGEIQWDGHIFQRNDPPDAHWDVVTDMKNAADVSNTPPNWTPDKTYVKRQIHFTEPPNETENPFVRAFVEKNVVDLDSGDRGSLINDINLEVRVDNVGALNVGPIFLGADLEGSKQIVEVTFKIDGQTYDGHDRVPAKFTWHYEDQTQPRYLMVFTGQPDFIPKYQYQVRVIVKGSIFTHGMEWTGPWVASGGNGSLMITVPTPQDQGVTTRSIPPGVFKSLAEPSVTQPTPPVTTPPQQPGVPATPPPTPSHPGVTPPPVVREPAYSGAGMGWTGKTPPQGSSRGYMGEDMTKDKGSGYRSGPNGGGNGSEDKPIFRDFSIERPRS